MKNASDSHLSTGIYTQPSDDELYSISNSLLPTQNEMDAMSRSTNASMQTMTRNDINIPSDNSAATVTTTNTDICRELQTAADDLRQLIKEAEK